MMNGDYSMPLFLPPIAPVREGGRTVKDASLVLEMTTGLEYVHRLIRYDEGLARQTDAVRRAADAGDGKLCRRLKAATLPYVTPCGVFSRRRCDCLVRPSGLVVVDIDHLPSVTQAERLREALFADAYLRPELVFVSPTGRGVKAFVPWSEPDIALGTRWAMSYVASIYGEETVSGSGGVDTSGKDIVRTCFLCHDPGALLRE